MRQWPADARGRQKTQQFTVRSSNMRVYEAVWVENVSESEPEEAFEFEALSDVPLEGALDDSFAGEDDLEEDNEFDEWVQREETGPFSELLPEDAGAAADEPAVLKILAAANETDPPDDEPDDSSSSGLRRLARGYGTLVKGLFGRRRGRAA